MSIMAITIITIAALIHAAWNAVAKKAIDVIVFAWLSCLFATIIYSPIAAYVLCNMNSPLDATACGALFTTVLCTCVGFLCILLGYKIGDYSVMYPVSRGTGPLIATMAAILFLNERPSIAALAGIAMIVLGVFIIGGGFTITTRAKAKPVAFGILTGALIANTTVWAKHCISNHGIPFFLVDYAAIFGMLLIISPYVFKKRELLKREWQENKNAALIVGICRSLAYLLVLFVLSTTPVYYVAPLREMSILFATIIGAKLFKEGHSRRRLAAAFVLFSGLVSLSIN